MILKQSLLCLLFAVSIPIGQVLFKLAAQKSTAMPGGFAEKILFNPFLYGAMAWYGISSLLWYFILMNTKLSSAYVFVVVGSCLVPFAAWAVFGERPGTQYFVGAAIMFLGFFIAVQDRF